MPEQPPLGRRRRTPGPARARACARRRGRAPRRAAGRCAAAGGAAPSRGASVATPTVCSSSPPAYEWWSSDVAGNAARSRSPSTASTVARSPGCVSSATRNSRNPPSSSRSRRSAGVSVCGIDVRRLERAHVELQPVAELLDAGEHAHRVALCEAAVEQLDVVPHPRLDAAGRVDELEREVRGAGLRAQLALHAHRVDALDDAVLLQLGDRHEAEPTAASRCGSPPRRRGPRRPRRGSPPPPCAASRRRRRGRRRSARRSARGRAAPARAAPSSRDGELPGTDHLRSSRSCASAPHGPSCSTRCELVRTSRWWSDAIARSTVLLVEPGRLAELRAR